MAYRIQYCKQTVKKISQKHLKIGVIFSTILLVGALVARISYQSVISQLSSWLLPPAAVQAVSNFTDSFAQGSDFSDAVTAFCQQLMDNANEK